MKKIIIITLASGLGTGYAPIASGTAGSLLAVIIYWFLIPKNYLTLAVISFVLLAVSIPICSYAEKHYGKKDDGRIVLDEVVGMFFSVMFLPYSWKICVAAFFLFRAMDVLKPLGIRKTQDLGGGLGIVIDDVLAGILTNLILQTALLVYGVFR